MIDSVAFKIFFLRFLKEYNIYNEFIHEMKRYYKKINETALGNDYMNVSRRNFHIFIDGFLMFGEDRRKNPFYYAFEFSESKRGSSYWWNITDIYQTHYRLWHHKIMSNKIGKNYAK